MFCPNCGEQNPTGAKFCGHCGTTLSGPGDAAERAPEPRAAAAQPTPSAEHARTGPRSTTTREATRAAPPPPQPVATAPPAPTRAAPPPAGPAPSTAQPFAQWQRPASSTVASHEPVSSGVNIAIIAMAVILPFLGSLIAILAGVVYAADSNPARKSAGKLWLGVGIVMFVVWALLLEAASEPILF